MNEINRVECRVRRIVWLGILMCLAMDFGLAALPFMPDGKGNYPDMHRSQTAPYVWTFAWIFLTFVLVTFLILWATRSYIIADENGLRWRNIKQERFAR